MQWRARVDAFVPEGSRWHSTRVGLVQTQDAIGDGLVARLREASRTAPDDTALSRWIETLVWRLEDYEEEPRRLARLADTGRVVKILRGAVKASLDILQIEGEAATSWWRELERERLQRVELYRLLVGAPPILSRCYGQKCKAKTSSYKC